MTKKKLIEICIATSFVLSLSAIGFSIKNMKDINNIIKETNISNKDNESKIGKLYDSEYFKDKQIDVASLNALSDIFTLGDDYFVYFYKDGCTYCEDTSPAIMKYLREVKEGMPDINFFDMGSEKASQYWDDGSMEKNDDITPNNFKVIGTPTLLHIKDNTIKMYVGQVEIEDALARGNL